jgi:DNA-binding transcriptional MerR regulator
MNQFEIEIPKKSFFYQEEVCSLTDVKPYVLRFWETEFEELEPIVSSSGQKLYERKDIEAVLKIKKLLFQEKMTIAKAKQSLKNSDADLSLEIPVIAMEEVQQVQQIVHRTLNEREWQKLILTRAKLSSIVLQVSTIKQSYDWI